MLLTSEPKMRMWSLPTQILCCKHLLGEHRELHMYVGCILKNKDLSTYIQRGYVEIHKIHSRHDELVKEFHVRGYNHNSPLPHFKEVMAGKIDISFNLYDLLSRCNDCRARFYESQKHNLYKGLNLLIPNR